MSRTWKLTCALDIVSTTQFAVFQLMNEIIISVIAPDTTPAW